MPGPDTIRSACRITAPHRSTEESAQLDRCWADQNVLDRYTRIDRAQLPRFRWVKLAGCLGLHPNSARLGPWYTRIVAKALFERGAKICLNLTGDQRGLLLQHRIGTISGIVLKTHNEYLRVHKKKITVRHGAPYVYSTYKRYLLFFIPYGKRQLRMNPLVNFRTKIPTHYLPGTGRRFNRVEMDELHSRSGLKGLPLLGNAVRTGRLPQVLSYDQLMSFMRVWMKTWSEKRPPKTAKEKIAHDVGKLFMRSLGGSNAKIEVAFDQLRFPGFYARMAKTNKATITFSAGSVLEPPYQLGITSKVDVDRLFLTGLLDLRRMSATVSSKVTIDRDGFALSLAIPFINARFNPFRYSVGNEGSPALVTTLGGRAFSGIGTSDMPSGLYLTKDKVGNVRVTLNLNTTHHVRTTRGDFVVEGGLRIRLNAKWVPGQLPRIVPDGNTIEIRDLRIRRKGETKPLIARAHLLISDRRADKRMLRRLHPDFATVNSGFIVQLTADDMNVGGVRKGRVASYIHVPLNRGNDYYDPTRFSIQRMLDLAFGLAMKDGRTIRGRFQVKRLAQMFLGKRLIRGKGIEIMGNVVSLSETRTRHLLRNGHMKLMWKPAKGGSGREFFAMVRADKIGLPHGTVYNPSFDAHLNISNGNGRFNLGIRRARLHIPYLTSNGTSVVHGRINLARGMITYGGRRFASVNMGHLRASFFKLRTPGLRVGRGVISTWRPLIMSRRGDHLNIKSLGLYFRFLRAMPRRLPPKLRRAFRGRISSLDIQGNFGGTWKHNLKTNRGRGWLELKGSKKYGDIHFRDGRGRRITKFFTVKGVRKKYPLPFLSDTRWIMVRMDGKDRRGGWIKGTLCLKTDIDLMALKPLGIRYSDYIEWRMSHDNVATSLRAFLARAQQYYRDVERGAGLPRGASHRGDLCRRIFDGK